MFLDHTQRRTTVGRTPLDEWSARRPDLYLTTHNTHTRQTSMPPVEFEPTIWAGERPKTYALDRAATGTGLISVNQKHFIRMVGVIFGGFVKPLSHDWYIWQIFVTCGCSSLRGKAVLVKNVGHLFVSHRPSLDVIHVKWTANTCLFLQSRFYIASMPWEQSDNYSLGSFNSVNICNNIQHNTKFFH